ncbi:MAG TPA: hypothetical protein VKA27_07805 [Sunxiuqinia sp.]|nr:hypothetical protein [Sunxiuqinia sp.]
MTIASEFIQFLEQSEFISSYKTTKSPIIFFLRSEKLPLLPIMHSHKHIANRVFTFHQWNGKCYAVFASLGKLIRIGKLSTTISQHFYSKNVSQPAAFVKWLADSSPEENADELKSPDPGATLLELLGLQWAVILTSKLTIHPAKELPLLGWNELIICLIKVRFLLRAGNGLFNTYQS